MWSPDTPFIEPSIKLNQEPAAVHISIRRGGGLRNGASGPRDLSRMAPPTLTSGNTFRGLGWAWGDETVESDKGKRW